MLTAEDEVLLNKLANFIVKRGMTAPAILFLESSKPLSFVGSQFLVALGPLVKIFFDYKEYDQITKIMEDRANVETFICMIEKLSSESEKK
ncbi:MAG: hypothetical protein QMC67_09420 [Candidatus Wallbacteria bacterium]